MLVRGCDPFVSKILIYSMFSINEYISCIVKKKKKKIVRDYTEVILFYFCVKESFGPSRNETKPTNLLQ